MFTYWKGYEIDGSSTTYNIVVPQRELVSEVLRYFINLKIIDRSSDISLSFSEGQKNSSKSLEYRNESYKSDDIDKLCEILERPSTQSFFINTNCIHPDKLYHEVRKDLYNISKTRPGAEERVYNYKNPTVSPLYFGPDLGVSFEISFGKEQVVENYEPEGLVFNDKALINNMKVQHFTIDFGCGPGFIFEYAAYINSKMAERFPEIGIDGGIDCAGGFIDGCTYSCSLYAYERITLVSEKIAKTINSLLSEGLVLPQKRAGKYGNEILPCDNLFLFNLHDVDRWHDESIGGKSKAIKGIVSGKKECTPEEYECFVRKVSEIEMFDRVDFMHYCTCCIKIDDNICALTCIKEKERIWLELRVAPGIRDDVEKKLKFYGVSIR
ncbi:hypothetical protein DFR58_12416 [Anaerobacterium chartisolvens]|uniref:Uncharacterized protein n=1 Tax=Anaerobacterium chartisolvens TaxID=1297424 RepID=A0A369AUY5_9FIRM|nr:hypothetical protein [Anaerobacterium chartisolvens]RCX12066.1 hypothetical protein DFR58_12416 [Anaerobacterium chartisolvens]